jgi:hypothetical membrane protein
MNPDRRLLFGPLAAALLFVGVAALPLGVPGYDAVRQTVSEIGEAGSPMRLPFTILLSAVSLCLMVFAWGLGRHGASRWPAYFTAAFAISVAGVGVFAFPHDLHNLFGMSQLIGYQAPLVLALTWRRAPGARAAVAVSVVMAALVLVMIVLNLASIIDRGGDGLWAMVGPVYGLVQRGLFAAWFAWAAALGLLLWRARPTS